MISSLFEHDSAQRSAFVARENRFHFSGSCSVLSDDRFRRGMFGRCGDTPQRSPMLSTLRDDLGREILEALKLRYP